MKYKLIILLFLGFALSTSGQNLITNGSFEEPENPCPTVINFPIVNVTGWYTPSWNTPDLYAACAPPFEGGLPQTNKGFQHAKEGTKIAGGVFYPSNRDFLTNKLIYQLEKGKTYCVKFYINLSDADPLPIDRIGIYFSADSIYYNTYFELPVNPHYETPLGEFFADTINWIPVSFQYVATGSERYVTIGNFNSDSETNTLPPDTINNYCCSYYYFDDFSLEECKWNGIVESNINQVSIYPNPSAGAIAISYNLPNIKNAVFSLYTTSGQLLFNTPINTYKNSQTIETDVLENGVYLYTVTAANGIIASGKLVLIK